MFLNFQFKNIYNFYLIDSISDMLQEYDDPIIKHVLDLIFDEFPKRFKQDSTRKRISLTRRTAKIIIIQGNASEIELKLKSVYAIC
ncbi:hypothetical protein N403_05675 [Helicobacter pylori FD430]|nr:hypothetical protein N403_05675 [Helicobacter pylori FD430]